MFSRSTNLQEMCLTAVVKEIDFFVYHKTIPERQVSFLFHVYAEEVFSLHKTLRSYINEDCMMWFLHPRVKKVTLRNFHSKRIIERLKEIGSGITSLNLHKSEITEKELNSVICCIPNVVHLDLSETSCSDETLTCIRKHCPNLESLNVSACDVTDSGMKNLCSDSNKLLLKNLNILYSDIEALGVVDILNGMPSLECFKYDDLANLLYEVKRDFGYCPKYNLTEFDFDDNSVKVVTACAKMCPKTKKLRFNFPVHEKVLRASTHFNNLEELKIKMSHAYYVDVRVKNVLIPILPLSQNLKTLILSCVEMSALTLVEHFKNLENLFLKNVSFVPFKRENIKITKTKLRTLVMNDIRMQVDDANFQGVNLLISLSQDVTKLHLKHIKHLPPEILDVTLKSMKNLAVVNFYYTRIEVHFLYLFFEISSMTTVIANCIDDADTPVRKMLPKNCSCTLSWRYMYDNDDNDSDDNDDCETFDGTGANDCETFDGSGADDCKIFDDSGANDDCETFDGNGANKDCETFDGNGANKDCEKFDGNGDNTKCYYYDDSDENDIISDTCNSTDSESDGYYFQQDPYDMDYDVYDWYDGMFF